MQALVLLGAPGAGKGSVAGHLASHAGFRPFSTGRRIREEMANPDSAFGRLARPFMERGDFIPDELALRLVSDTLSTATPDTRWVFDGFPRTAAQASSFDRVLASHGARLRLALHLSSPDAVLRERLAGRWNCASCGATFHRVHRPPRVPGCCDECQDVLISREDDQGELAERRLALYPERSRGLADFYRSDGRLRVVAADRALVEVLRDAEQAVRECMS